MLLAPGLSDRELIATLAARTLIEIQAVLFNAETPFVFTSGKTSPVYIDCRKILGFPRARTLLTDFAITTLIRDVGVESFDVIAGGETAGIPFAAWIADRLDLPMAYIRKKPKGFGRMAQIEGHMPEGARVLLVEDLTTDGGSKVKFVDAIRQAGGVVDHTFVHFHYGIFPASLETMGQIGVKLHALTTWWDVLRVARENQYFTPETLAVVEDFLHRPHEWTPAATS